mgnify:CR=1 FL=1
MDLEDRDADVKVRKGIFTALVLLVQAEVDLLSYLVCENVHGRADISITSKGEANFSAHLSPVDVVVAAAVGHTNIDTEEMTEKVVKTHPKSAIVVGEDHI